MTHSMIDLLQRLFWFSAASAIVSYAVFIVAGHAIQSYALEETRTVVIRDALQVGQHTLSGMVMVPSTCKQLSVRAEQLSNTLFHIRFKTWEEPYVHCDIVDTPRAFRVIVFGPSVGIQFISTIDEAPLKIVVTPTTEYIH